MSPITLIFAFCMHAHSDSPLADLGCRDRVTHCYQKIRATESHAVGACVDFEKSGILNDDGSVRLESISDYEENDLP